jgi:SAM-dependent methyltransferase
MNPAAESFRAFERSGWGDPQICAEYHRQLSEVTRQAVDPLLDAVDVASGERLLDIATGAGYVAGAAAERGAQAAGLDFSAEQIVLARSTYPDVRFQVGDAERLPFADSTFDCVVSAFGVPHFPDPARALGQMHRVLKPAGRVAFSVWDVPERAVVFGAVYAAIRSHGSLDVGIPAGPDFFSFSDPATCEAQLRRAGFVRPEVHTVRQTWQLRSPEDAFATILTSTVRASATLKAQTPQAREAIRQAFCEALSEYRDGDRYLVPMPALVASAVKPA